MSQRGRCQHEKERLFDTLIGGCGVEIGGVVSHWGGLPPKVKLTQVEIEIT